MLRCGQRPDKKQKEIKMVTEEIEDIVRQACEDLDRAMKLLDTIAEQRRKNLSAIQSCIAEAARVAQDYATALKEIQL